MTTFREAVGDEDVRITPNNNPITNPPICAKLSIPGNNPSTSANAAENNKTTNSRIGLLTSFQRNKRSVTSNPTKPNNAPEHPMEAIKNKLVSLNTY